MIFGTPPDSVQTDPPPLSLRPSQNTPSISAIDPRDAQPTSKNAPSMRENGLSVPPESYHCSMLLVQKNRIVRRATMTPTI